MGAVKEFLVSPNWERELQWQRENEAFAEAVFAIAKRLKDTPPEYAKHMHAELLERATDHITFLEINR